MNKRGANAQPVMPPNDATAEAGALGCVLSANGDAGTLLDQLSEADFSDLRHGAIYRALQGLHEQGRALGLVELHDTLKTRGALDDVGGFDYLQRLPDATPSPENFTAFLAVLRDRTARREMLREAENLTVRARDLATPIEASEPDARIKATPLGELVREDRSNEDVLLGNRYLCRGGGLLLCGPSGIGKSVLTLQLAMAWALGRSQFGIAPSRRLTSVIVQAENDEGDVCEMRDGVLCGLGLSAEEIETAVNDVLILREDQHTGEAFCRRVLRPLLRLHRPDLLWIDPMLSYLGGDMNSQQDVGGFLRNLLNPLIREFGCAAVLAHHTNKPASGREKPNWQGGDYAYLGAGSAEWANWARAVLAIRSLGSRTVFALEAGKRGARLGWVDDNGERTFTRFVGHAKDANGICWRTADADEAGGQGGRPKSYSADELLELLPGDGLKAGEWQEKAKEELGISPTSFHRERNALLAGKRIMKSKVSGRYQPVKKA